MLEYDNPILHTSLWEEFNNQPWEPLTESKGKWKDHDYTAVHNTNAFKSGYTLREFTNANQFINALRPEVVAKSSFPLEISIGFVNEKTLDKVEFTITFEEPEMAKLEVTTSQAVIYNQLKNTQSFYRDNNPEISPESDPKKQNGLTWSEKTVKSSLPTAKCHQLCKKAIDKLKVKRFREIKKDENFWALIKKNESYKNCIVDLRMFNEVFQQQNISEAEEYIADDLEFNVPGTAKDFTQFQSFLDYIKTENILANASKKVLKYPLDVYIQFASKDNARAACIWIAYSDAPQDKKKNVRLTLFTAIPYMYRKVPQKIVVKTIRDKKDLIEVIQSPDLYIDWNYSRKHYDTTAKDAYWVAKRMILKLIGNNYVPFPDGIDIIEFATSKPELSTRPVLVDHRQGDKSQLKSDGKRKAGGRPKGSTKKKEW